MLRKWKAVVSGEGIQRTSPFSEKCISTANVDNDNQRSKKTGADVRIGRVKEYLDERDKCGGVGDGGDVPNAETNCHKEYEAGDRTYID